MLMSFKLISMANRIYLRNFLAFFFFALLESSERCNLDRGFGAVAFFLPLCGGAGLGLESDSPGFGVDPTTGPLVLLLLLLLLTILVAPFNAALKQQEKERKV